MIRVGILGLGKIAQLHHIPNLKKNSMVEITCLADLTVDHCVNIAEKFSITKTGFALPDSVPWSDLDAVFILNRSHAPYIARALRFNVPCFVEKPVCWTQSEVDELRTGLGSEAADISMVGYMKRYIPAVRELVRQVHAVGVGDLAVSVHAGGSHKSSEEKPLRPTGIVRSLRSEAHMLGIDSGSALRSQRDRTVLELGIHSLNLTRALLGPSCKVVRAEHDEDTGEVVIRLAHAGGTGVLQVVPDFDGESDWDDRIELQIGAESRVMTFSNPFQTTSGASEDLSVTQGFELEVEEFLCNVAEQRPSATSLSEGLDDVELALDILQRNFHAF